jgi:hypothetical protein
VFNHQLNRTTVYEPNNIEAVLAAVPTVTPPIWKVKALQGSGADVYSLFSDELQSSWEMLDHRNRDIIYDTEPQDGQRVLTVNETLARQRDNRTKLTSLLNDLQLKLSDMLSHPDAETTADSGQ